MASTRVDELCRIDVLPFVQECLNSLDRGALTRTHRKIQKRMTSLVHTPPCLIEVYLYLDRRISAPPPLLLQWNGQQLESPNAQREVESMLLSVRSESIAYYETTSINRLLDIATRALYIMGSMQRDAPSQIVLVRRFWRVCSQKRTVYLYIFQFMLRIDIRGDGSCRVLGSLSYKGQVIPLVGEKYMQKIYLQRPLVVEVPFEDDPELVEVLQRGVQEEVRAVQLKNDYQVEIKLLVGDVIARPAWLSTVNMCTLSSL